MQKFKARLIELMTEPLDSVYLAYLRIAFSATMLIEIWRLYKKNHIYHLWIEPKFHFTYYGFDWVSPWPGDGMYYHFAVMAIAAVLMLFGLCYRFASIVFFLGFTYVFLLEKAQYLNHFYLILLLSFLLTLVPANAMLSLDARYNKKLYSRVVPGWTIRIFRLQLAIVYFYASLVKLYPDWLDALPAKTWLIGVAQRTGYPLDQPLIAYFMSYGGILFDLLFIPLVSRPKTRVLALFFCIFFHLTNSQIFRIGIFPWLMLAITPIFLPANWIRALLLLNRFKIKSRSDKMACEMPGRALQMLLSAYFILQLTLPLRHFYYPGSSVWTEEGGKFSWQMMLRSKVGQVAFIVNDASTPDQKMPFPYPYHLKSYQVHRMETEPDLILEYAHFIRDEMKRRGIMKDPEVRVKSDVSLNARKPRPLIDPTVDLAKQPRSLFEHYWWIMPTPREWP